MRFHFRLIFSPLKWLGCLLFVCIIPIAMYVPTYFDFVNVSSIYMPFVGVVLFSDIAILDKLNNTEEIIYLSSSKPAQAFIQRYLISLGTLLLYLVLANGVFRVLQRFNGDVMIEPISFFEYIAIAGCGSLFIGTIAMTVSAVLGNVYIGYGLAIVYWVYWNINCLTSAIINPFPFIANPTFYESPLIIIYGFSTALAMFACFFASKSPFYLQDRRYKRHGR